MIIFNPRYEIIFDPKIIKQDCDRIADLMSVEANLIKKALEMQSCINR